MTVTFDTGLPDKEKLAVSKKFTECGDPELCAMWDAHKDSVLLTTDYDTVALEKIGPKFRINANVVYWKKLPFKKKVFIIAHELLHVKFNHWHIGKKEDRDWANVAQDIQVNEYIADHFPNLVKNLPGRRDDAWIDTVFKHKKHLVERGREYQYYYGLLMKCLK